MELICKSFLQRNAEKHVSFLDHQQQPHTDNNNNEWDTNKDEEINDDDSYYGDSDYVGQVDNELNDNNNNNLWIPTAESIKPDLRMIRQILKLMCNLVQTANTVQFSVSHRQQLIMFLSEVRIGEESSFTLDVLARKDNVIAAFLIVLRDQIEGRPSSTNNELMHWIE